MSEFLREQLKRQEGYRFSAYEDTNGYVTIGYGHMIDQERGGGISVRVAELLLDDDIYEARKQLDRVYPWTNGLKQQRYDVLVNMVFQMGISGLGTFRRMLAHLQKAEYEAAANEMLDSKWARNHLTRAGELSEQMRFGRYKGEKEV